MSSKTLALRLSKLERKVCPGKPMVIEIMHYADELPSDEDIRKCQAQLAPHIKIELKLYKEWLAEQQEM